MWNLELGRHPGAAGRSSVGESWLYVPSVRGFCDSSPGGATFLISQGLLWQYEEESGSGKSRVPKKLIFPLNRSYAGEQIADFRRIVFGVERHGCLLR